MFNHPTRLQFETFDKMLDYIFSSNAIINMQAFEHPATFCIDLCSVKAFLQIFMFHQLPFECKCQAKAVGSKTSFLIPALQFPIHSLCVVIIFFFANTTKLKCFFTFKYMVHLLYNMLPFIFITLLLLYLQF